MSDFDDCVLLLANMTDDDLIAQVMETPSLVRELIQAYWRERSVSIGLEDSRDIETRVAQHLEPPSIAQIRDEFMRRLDLTMTIHPTDDNQVRPPRRRVTARTLELRAKAADMRARGATWRDMAGALGVSFSYLGELFDPDKYSATRRRRYLRRRGAR